MRTRLASPEGKRLLEQARRFELRHACEHCAHFDERLEACGHGYPTAEHRLSATAAITFCKEFELG
jgi:hypothetical protein